MPGSNARLCPLCRQPSRLVPPSTTRAVIEFYRCASCGAVWLHDTRNPDAPPKILGARRLGTSSESTCCHTSSRLVVVDLALWAIARFAFLSTRRQGPLGRTDVARAHGAPCRTVASKFSKSAAGRRHARDRSWDRAAGRGPTVPVRVSSYCVLGRPAEIPDAVSTPAIGQVGCEKSFWRLGTGSAP